MRGSHLLKTWSQAKRVIALSTGEAELISCVKAAGLAVGIQSTGKDYAQEMGITVAIDASAAYGMLHRKGVGKMRHVDTSILWVQDAAFSGRIKFVRVAGRDLPADLMTKPLAREAAAKFLKQMNTDRRSGRARISPTLNK